MRTLEAAMRATQVAMLLLLVPGMLLISAVTDAATLARGTFELSPSFSFTQTYLSFDGNAIGTITNLRIDGEVGYCVSNLVEIGGTAIVGHSSFDPEAASASSLTSEGLALGLGINFATAGNVVPFVRGAVGLLAYSGDIAIGKETSVLAPILDAGIRLMVGGSASVNFGVDYRHTTNDGGLKD